VWILEGNIEEKGSGSQKFGRRYKQQAKVD